MIKLTDRCNSATDHFETLGPAAAAAPAAAAKLRAGRGGAGSAMPETRAAWRHIVEEISFDGMATAIWVRKSRSFADEAIADREFWAQMTGDERVEALENLRQEAWKVTGERLERLRRVVRVSERPRR
jgi:hypothetical protein